MSSLFQSESEPVYQPQSEQASEAAEPVVTPANASAEVQLALRKFWDVVRASAETIVMLRQEVVQLKAQKPAQVEVESAESLARIRELQGALADSQGALADSQGALADSQGALADSQEMSRLLEADVANSMRHVAELEAALEDGRTAQLQMRTEISQTLQNLETDLATSNHHRSLLEQDLAGMSLRVAELEARLDEKSDQLSDATEMSVKFDILQREREELERRVERLQQRAADLEGLVDEKNSRNEVLGSELSRARQDVVELEFQLSARQAELQEHQQTLTEITERLQAMECEAVRALDEGSSADIERMSDQVIDLQEQLQRAMAIVELYRAAGLRHIEDPAQRDQMVLFATAFAAPSIVAQPSAMVNGTRSSDAASGMAPEELLLVADRLDELAERVEDLLRIS
jgi:chromosome segregation ATPase